MWRDVLAILLPLGLSTVFREGDTDPNWSSLWSFLKRIWFWIVLIVKVCDEAEFLQKAGRASVPNAFRASLMISPRSLRCLVCIRVQDAALSCTAAGTDAQWAHTRPVSSSLIFISAGPGVVDYQFVQRVVSHPKRTETTESWCTKYVAMASWPISASNHLHLMHSAAWDICHLIKSPKRHGLRSQGRGEIWEWSGTIVMRAMSRCLVFESIPAKSSVVQWLGLATLKMQAPKTPKHDRL